MGTVSGNRKRNSKAGHEVMQSSNPIEIPLPVGRFKTDELTVVQSVSSQQEEILKNT